MTETIVVPVAAQSLKIGDRFTSGAEVNSVDVKTKYVYVELAKSGVNWDEKYDKDATFDILREVPTAEETAAKELQHTLLSLDFKEANARRTLEHARAKMIKSLEAGERPESYHWMDVPEAQAVVDLWDSVAHVHEVHALRDDIEDMTRLEAVRFVRDEQRKQSLSYYRALSRSTSIMSNLFDDLKIAALSEWSRELMWILLDD